MIRKHFEAIARILRDNGANEALCLEFADYLKTQNDLFNYDRFMNACKQTEAV